MSDFDVEEKRFEEDIENYLCSEGDYTKGNPASFDRKLALDNDTFLIFIKISRSKRWEIQCVGGVSYLIVLYRYINLNTN